MSGKGKTHKLPKSKKQIVYFTPNLVREENLINAMTKLNIKEKKESVAITKPNIAGKKESNAFNKFDNMFFALEQVKKEVAEEEKKRKQYSKAAREALQSMKIQSISHKGRLVKKPAVYGKGYLRRKTIKNNKRK